MSKHRADLRSFRKEYTKFSKLFSKSDGDCFHEVIYFLRLNIFRIISFNFLGILGKPEGKTSHGRRPKHRWEDDIEMDFQAIGGRGLDCCVLYRDCPVVLHRALSNIKSLLLSGLFWLS
jgi:hypothetical protein